MLSRYVRTKHITHITNDTKLIVEKDGFLLKWPAWILDLTESLEREIEIDKICCRHIPENYVKLTAELQAAVTNLQECSEVQEALQQHFREELMMNVSRYILYYFPLSCRTVNIYTYIYI